MVFTRRRTLAAASLAALLLLTVLTPGAVAGASLTCTFTQDSSGKTPTYSSGCKTEAAEASLPAPIPEAAFGALDAGHALLVQHGLCPKDGSDCLGGKVPGAGVTVEHYQKNKTYVGHVTLLKQ